MTTNDDLKNENPTFGNVLLYAVADVIGFRYKGGRFVTY